MLHLALDLAELPDTPSTRARLRACLEGVPPRERPPLVRVCLVTTLAYGARQWDGTYIYDNDPAQNVSNVDRWRITPALGQAGAEVLAVHERKIARWFGAPPAPPLGPLAGRRAQPLEYLDPDVVAEYAAEAASWVRVYDGAASRMAEELLALLDKWYGLVKARRHRAKKKGQLGPYAVAYPGGRKAFRRAAHAALFAVVPGLPPLPSAQTTPRRSRPTLLPAHRR
jgi:hypothetical protein